MIALELPADLRALRVIGPWLRAVLEYGEEPEIDAAAKRLELALQEVCVNVVEHAYGGRVGERITVEYEPRAADHNFVVRDTGAAFDPDDRPDVDLARPTEGGYGLFIAESLCDCLVYERRDGVNRWTLALRRSTQVAS